MKERILRVLRVLRVIFGLIVSLHALGVFTYGMLAAFPVVTGWTDAWMQNSTGVSRYFSSFVGLVYIGVFIKGWVYVVSDIMPIFTGLRLISTSRGWRIIRY